MAKEQPAEAVESGPAASAAVPPAMPGRRGRLIAIAAVLALLLGGGGAAAWFLMGRSPPPVAPAEGAAAAAAAVKPRALPDAPPQYLALSPAFVVNLADDATLRYLQCDIELMARDAATIDAVKQHQPMIRNALLLLLGQQRYENLNHRAGKEKLQAEALAEVRRILEAQASVPGVEALFFTSLVVQ